LKATALNFEAISYDFERAAFGFEALAYDFAAVALNFEATAFGLKSTPLFLAIHTPSRLADASRLARKKEEV
jgi:hypothetical protein